MLGDVMFYGKGAGSLPTASAVVSDVVDAVKRHGYTAKIHWSTEKRDIVDAGSIATQNFVRVSGDKAAISSKIEASFGQVEYIESDKSSGEVAFITKVLSGREYEKAVILMDDSFSYDSHGHLCGIPVPDPDNMYPNIFYQGITRVRENLALIIMDAPELLRSILSIID